MSELSGAAAHPHPAVSQLAALHHFRAYVAIGVENYLLSLKPAPLRFLPQIVLGIRQEAAGAASFTISPWLGELEWARGAVYTCRGLLEVSWRKESGQLHVSAKAPAGVELRFEENESMQGLAVSFEKEEINRITG